MANLPKLVLHFDVNETIMVGDPAGGDTFEESLNKIICKSSFVSRDGSAFLGGTAVGSAAAGGAPGPDLHTAWDWPEGFLPYYRHDKAAAKTFTHEGQAGEAYRHWYTLCKDCLSVPEDVEVDKRLSHDGKHYFLIPAFYRTISELTRRGRVFSIVIRTFGSDMGDVVAAMAAFAEGAVHQALQAERDEGGVPFFKLEQPPSPSWAFSTAPWTGRFSKDGAFKMTSSADGVEPITDESVAVATLQGAPDSCAVVGCQDHYEYWNDNNNAPSCGKPVWLTEDESDTFHHIIFDDNIHNDEDDSIVAVRKRATAADPFVAVSGKETLRYQGVNLVRVPTVEPVLDPDWFIKQIDKCEAAAALQKRAGM